MPYESHLLLDHSLLITRLSSLVILNSPLFTYHPLLFFHHSPLTSHLSPLSLTTHHSSPITLHSPLIIHHSPLSLTTHHTPCTRLPQAELQRQRDQNSSLKAALSSAEMDAKIKIKDLENAKTKYAPISHCFLFTIIFLFSCFLVSFHFYFFHHL